MRIIIAEEMLEQFGSRNGTTLVVHEIGDQSIFG